MNIEDYYKEKNWWESHNPEADWEKLYETYPDVDWNAFYSSLPEQLLPKGESNGPRD